MKLHFFKIGNPVTNQSIVIMVLITSYKVFYLHVKCLHEIHVYTCSAGIECSLYVLCMVPLRNVNSLLVESLFTLTVLRFGCMKWN